MCNKFKEFTKNPVKYLTDLNTNKGKVKKFLQMEEAGLELVCGFMKIDPQKRLSLLSLYDSSSKNYNTAK